MARRLVVKCASRDWLRVSDEAISEASKPILPRKTSREL